MVRNLYRFVRPIDSYHPQKRELQCRDNKPALFKVCPMQPRTHDLTVEWRLEIDMLQESKYGQLTGVGNKGRRLTGKQDSDRSGRKWHYLPLEVAQLPPGRYFVVAKVSDPTPWVRQDSEKRLTQEQRWQITISRPASK